ncbi:MAG: lactoylglutathione lyase [Weeksellaceae bacterium]|nr:lactoylglutathione lyase [Weeksellaceae bacterium]
MSPFLKIHTILYITSQEISKDFYEKVFRIPPTLDVPGMTEFDLSSAFTLGLMPNSSISRILQDQTPDPATGTGIPRCELYLYVDDVEAEYENAVEMGAKIISPLLIQNWGDLAFYLADPDGHIIVFATKIKKPAP